MTFTPKILAFLAAFLCFLIALGIALGAIHGPADEWQAGGFVLLTLGFLLSR